MHLRYKCLSFLQNSDKTKQMALGLKLARGTKGHLKQKKNLDGDRNPRGGESLSDNLEWQV